MGASGVAHEVVMRAFEATEFSKVYGATTVVLACMMRGVLGIANLGDSGCRVLRRQGVHGFRKTVHATEAQQCQWNCPYQVCRFPDQGEEAGTDIHETACYDWHMQPGDLVIVASDGVFDNLFDEEIESVTSMILSPQEKAQIEGESPVAHANEQANVAARCVVDCAVIVSQQQTRHTPWADSHVSQEGTGGKMDDITVVAAWVI
eukprot:Platyproteum_vivax@DN16042_c0_g1_i1.p3